MEVIAVDLMATRRSFTNDCSFSFAVMMILIVLSTVVVLLGHGVHASGSPIGNIFYIPNYNLLGEDITGGYPVFQNLAENCLGHSNNSIIDTTTTYYKDTEAFYSSLSSSTSLSAELESDFTMGVSLDFASKSISGEQRTVSGSTFIAFSKVSQEFFKPVCLEKEYLSDQIVETFENLNETIQSPWLASSWAGYQNFLQKFGSHVVMEVFYGSSLYQHTFAQTSSGYSEKQFAIKACVDLAAPTQAAVIDIGTCSGLTKEDINSVSNIQTSSQFVARGGSDSTRAELFSNRTKELIGQFLAEARSTHQPIQYKYTPIWSILKNIYFKTEHFPKAMNLEAYYKGYLNYGCQYSKGGNMELQKFTYSNNSIPGQPTFQCSIAPEGCQVDEDCHYRVSHARCECRGDSCVRHFNSTLNTGTERTTARINQAPGWKGPGCGHTCGCSYPNRVRQVVWTPAPDQNPSPFNQYEASYF